MRNLNAGYEEAVDLATLVDFAGNPNQGDTGVVADAIEEIGWYGAIVADIETRTVLAGHTRKRALLAAGETVAPVQWVRVDDLDHARRLLLVDNRATRVGYDDPQALVPLLEELARSAAGLAGTGWDGDDLDALLYEQRMAADALTDPPPVIPGFNRPPGREIVCPECGAKFDLRLGTVEPAG